MRIKFIIVMALMLMSFIGKTSDNMNFDNATILTMKQRASFINNNTRERVEQLLPKLMDDSGIDFWLMISREYNEDPILKTLLPAEWLSARRTTMLVFAKNQDKTVSAYAIAPYKIGELFKKAWDKTANPDQWQALLALIKQYDPKTIAINQSQHWAHADGMTATDKEKLFAVLPKQYQTRIVSAEQLGVAWLEQRIPNEMAVYENMVALTHDIIALGFSNKVIEVGKTTTDDLVWWFRDQVRQLRLQTWFHPSVSIQRKENKKFDHVDSFTNGYQTNIIVPGDLLHVDFGIHYLRLNTDIQQHAYVLKENEEQAPEELISAFTLGNKLQDILTNNFKVGRSGNEVLKKSRAQAIAQGLTPTIYTHPIGFHGHGAGTTIGMWDAQQGVSGSGDHPLHANTAYSIELNNTVFLKGWNKEIRIMLEENAFFNGENVQYLDERQTSLHIIQH
ncbi:M24 family metallopeptidase [Thalassotalea castellviae]|uniref:M24 family metallopeptidase n=1 Tax=Thalassotalea castellviae TaxID=3075612 RepID=A0ABU3A4E3_9GAMM|nr:M24 family metallopeptidase [Thalassotalea sp. W431]MDT0604670.1 M24 family metallopeptidase [Thalassotalea sp. W431]